jgi:predicted DNA-binding transcriptional regulator YafY
VNRIDRLLAILLELQRRGETRAQDLADHFEVSVRTVYRDVQAISETGVPVVATPGKGYRLMDGFFLPPVSFTSDEAAALVLGGEFVRERVDSELRKAADQALAKLEAILPAARRDEVARWRGELTFASARAPGDEVRLGELRAAIHNRNVLRIDYWGYRRPAAESREVEPVSLVHLRDGWSVAGYCRARQAGRFFRLERIQTYEVLRETFEPSERHRIGPGDGGPDESPEARVRFAPEVQRWVRDRNLYLFKREESDAFVYSLRDEHTLLHWLLGWGGQVEVLSPDSLRERIAAEASRVVEKHTDRVLSGARR